MAAQHNSQRIFKNTIFMFIRMIIVLLISLYTARVVLQVLGFEDFGIYNVVGSIVIFFGFFNSALTNATSRYLTFELGVGDNEKLKQVYSMGINCHVILAIILFLIMEIIGVWFINNHIEIPSNRMYATNWVFQLSLLTFCVNIIKIPFNSNAVAHEKMNFIAIIGIIEVLSKLAIVYMLLISSFDKLILYSALLFIVSLIVFIIYTIYCKIKFKDCFYIRYWNKKLFIKFSSYSGWSMLVNASDGTNMQCRSIFFNWFLGNTANAALGISNQVIGLMNTFVGNFSQAYKPQIIKSYAYGDKQYFMQLIYSTSKLSYYLFLLICIPIIFNLEFILKIWLVNYPAMTPDFIRATIIYTMFDIFQEPLWVAVHATGKLKTHQIIISSLKILSIPITYILLYLGYSGTTVLYVWASINIVCALARTIYMKILINLSIRKYLKETIWPMVIVSLFVIMIVLFVNFVIKDNWGHLILTTLVSTIILCITAYFLGLNKKEKQFVNNLPIIKKLIFFNEKTA